MDERAEVLRQAVEALVDRGAERVLVWHGKPAGEPTAWAGLVLEPKNFERATPFTLTDLGGLLSAGVPINLEKTQLTRKGRQGSLLCVPLHHEGRLDGFVYADLSGEFSAVDAEQIQRLARWLEAALANPAQPPEFPFERKLRRPMPMAQAAPAANGPAEVNSQARPSATGLVVFLRSLAVLQESGIPLNDGFELLEKTCDDKLMAEVAAELSQRVSAGDPISKVLSLYPGAFGPFQVELVRVGEATGTLSAVVGQLAECEQARQRLLRRVRAAVTYPSLVALLALVGLLVAPPYLLEGVFTVIRQSGQEPPWLTKAVMALSSALSTPWPWLLLAAAVAAGFSAAPAMLRRPEVWQRLLAVPGLGSCLRCAGMARFASALAVCQRAGLDLLAAVRLSAGASGDPVLLAREGSVRESIQDGNGLGTALKGTGYFTPMFLELVSSGEEVARVETMLDWIARSCEQELEAALEVYAALLEPAMLLAVGAVVALLVVATLAPMLTIIGTL